MVERAITATIEAHPECGVAMWAPRRLRDIKGFQMTTKRLDDDVVPVNKAAAMALDKVASTLAIDAAAERDRGVQTLILSEENFIGGMGNNFRTGVFYPDAQRRLAAFDSVLPTSPKTIALGIRDYASVWTSAYHYAPQSGQKPPPLGQVRNALLKKRRGWPQVVAAVQKVWPDTQILMWQQEELNNEARQICGNIADIDPALVVLPDGKINARKPSTARPEVFTQDECKQLTLRYKRHIRRLKDNANVRWATP